MSSDIGARPALLSAAFGLSVLAASPAAIAQPRDQPASSIPASETASNVTAGPSSGTAPVDVSAATQEPAATATTLPSSAAATTSVGSPATQPSADASTSVAPVSDILAPSKDQSSQPATNLKRPSRGRSAYLPDEDRYDAQRRRYYTNLYRPASNPARLNLGLRFGLVLQGSNQETQAGGRMFQVEVSAGHRWNHFGYNFGIQANVGRTQLLPETVTFISVVNGQNVLQSEKIYRESNFIAGAGPRFNLGRAGLMGIGYIDPEIAYNFFWAPASGAGEAEGSKDVSFPHGPEFRLDTGFIAPPQADRRWWHGFGTSLGYQIWVGSFKNSVPMIQSILLSARYQLL